MTVNNYDHLLHVALEKCVKQVGTHFYSVYKTYSRQFKRHGQRSLPIQPIACIIMYQTLLAVYDMMYHG